MKILLDVIRQIFFVFTFAPVLISCNSHSAAKAARDSLTNHPADTDQQTIANNPGTFTIAPALLKKYQEACQQRCSEITSQPTWCSASRRCPPTT